MLGWSFGKILIIILSLRVGTSKNKNTEHCVKETCAIMSMQVIYETNHTSLLGDSTMPNAINFCFFYVLYCNLKDHIRRIIISKINK